MQWLALIFSLIFATPLLAQTGEATVYGTVVTNGSAAPLQFATVAVMGNATDAVALGALTDNSGYFEIAGLGVGNYTITVSLAGYAPSQTSVLVFAGNDNYDLGTLALAAATQVEEITVIGQQQNAAPTLDSRVYNLADNIAQATGSVADVMRTLPGITLEQDGRVQLRGSDRVVILIDGKQSSLTGFGNQAGLDAIPAVGIESIEIINNPSSQFDANGMAGVINITYRKEKALGLTGDVGLTGAVGALTKRKDDLPTDLGSFSSNPKAIPSTNLTYNTEDKRYFFNAQAFMREGLPNNEFTSRFYDDGRITYSQVPENRKQIQGIISSGMDWAIDANNQFTVSTLLDYESHEDNAEVPFIDGRLNQRYRFWFWREEEDTSNFNLNAAYEHKFREPGHELSASMQFTYGNEDEDYFLNDRSAIRSSTDEFHLKATTYTLPLQIDYIKPTRTGRVETGAKYQQRKIPVTYDVVRGKDSIIYQGLGDESEWGEDVYSVYANLVHETPNYGIEGGVRVEQTDVYYQLAAANIYYPTSDSYDYFKVYPNLRFSLNLNESSRVAAYYSSRVDRPGEQELRIFPKYDDPEILKVGNPYLRPQFTNALELAYEQQWADGSFIFSVYHRDIDDTFIRVFDIDNSNPNYSILNRIYQNVGNSTNDGIELILTQDVQEFWKLSASVNLYQVEVEQYSTQLLFPYVRPFTVAESADDTWNLNMNNQFELPYDIRLQVSLTYYAEKNYAQGQEAARSSLDVGMNKPILQGRGELVFSVTDLFNKFGIQQNIAGNGFDAVYQNFFETQVVSLGLRYNLQ
jgi:outer membrane receptor protein involved in Fe transport